MATGTMPFHGNSQGLIFDGILNRTPASAVRLNPALPQELERIIDTCLEKDRERRYQDASEIRADLERLKRDRDSGRGPTAIFAARQHSPTRTRLSSRISITRPVTLYLTTRCARDCPWSFNNLRS